MAEKSASPRVSASLRSARPMVRITGRARIVSAPMRTCSCAMVVTSRATRVAFGAVAVGALAIGRLALGRVTVKRARFQALEVDELTVRKLRVREQEILPPRA